MLKEIVEATSIVLPALTAAKYFLDFSQRDRELKQRDVERTLDVIERFSSRTPNAELELLVNAIRAHEFGKVTGIADTAADERAAYLAFRERFQNVKWRDLNALAPMTQFSGGELNFVLGLGGLVRVGFGMLVVASSLAMAIASAILGFWASLQHSYVETFKWYAMGAIIFAVALLMYRDVVYPVTLYRMHRRKGVSGSAALVFDQIPTQFEDEGG